MTESITPFEKERERLNASARSMAYRADESVGDWQKRAREKLTALLGLPYERCAPRFCVEYETQAEDYYETRFTFQSEEGYYVPCHFLRPKGSLQGPLPVMICLQGHSTGMHISLGRVKYEGDGEDVEDGDRDYALQSVKRGMCAVTLEQRCFGERGGTPRPNCYLSAMTALLSGRTLLGCRVWDVMRLIDVLEAEFAGVCDAKRIYCCGNSGGGTATVYSAALEERIAAAMPSCAFCAFADSIGAMTHCACNYVPGIRRYFDMGELAGMIAPRPLVIVSGARDDIFPLPGAQSEFERVKAIYEAAGATERAVHVIGDGGHRFYATPSWDRFLALTGGAAAG